MKNPHEHDSPEWQLFENMKSQELLAGQFATEAESKIALAAAARSKADRYRKALEKLDRTETPPDDKEEEVMADIAKVKTTGGDQQTHVVERTSPKGGRFIGKCRLCGQEGLKASDALEPCPNPQGVSSDAALIGAILGGDDENHG